MDKRKKQQLGMLNAVYRFLTAAKELLEKNLGLKASFIVFEERLRRLNINYEQAQKKTSGITTGKQELKKQLAQEVAAIASPAHAWAFHNNDHVLLEATDCDESSLLKMTDTAMEKKCAALLDLIEQRNSTLGEYVLPVLMIANAQSLCDAFRGDTPAPRNAVAARSTMSRECNRESESLVILLEETIDRMVKTYKTSDPVFHDEYFSNRIIVDAGSRTTRITGKVTDQFTGNPLHKAVVTATDVNTAAKYEANTTVKGAYTLKIPAAGDYRLVYSHPQYQAGAEQLITITLGSQQKINSGLVPAK